MPHSWQSFGWGTFFFLSKDPRETEARLSKVPVTLRGDRGGCVHANCNYFYSHTPNTVSFQTLWMKGLLAGRSLEKSQKFTLAENIYNSFFLGKNNDKP